MEADRLRNHRVRCAVIDTNVLLYIYLNRADVISQLRDEGFRQVVVTESVIEELKKLERSLKGKERTAARFALKLVESCGFHVVSTSSRGDASLIEAAERLGCMLVTNDRSLKKRAKAKKIPTGYLKGDRRLVVEL